MTRAGVGKLLHGAQAQIPSANGTFEQAQKVKQDDGVQGALGI